MTKRNFLLGKGERLTEDIVIKSGGGSKESPYTFAEVQSRFTARMAEIVRKIDRLPSEACPRDEAVVTSHCIQSTSQSRIFHLSFFE